MMVSLLPLTSVVQNFNVTRASHIALTSRDLAKSRDFYTEIIGLKVSSETATTIHFRGVEEGTHHSLTLRATKTAPIVDRIGFRVFEDRDLDQARAYFERAGISSKFVNVPFQGRTLHLRDVVGTPLEFCARMQRVSRSHTLTSKHTGAGAKRISHFQLLVRDVVPASVFYCDIGFRVSDYSCINELVVSASLHRKQDPHDVIISRGMGPRLHHVGYIVEETHLIMRAIDSAIHLGFDNAIEHGPSRDGHSYRAYFRDPDGHRVALLLPPIQIIDADEGSTRHDVLRTKEWRTSPPELSEHASNFAGVKTASPA